MHEGELVYTSLILVDAFNVAYQGCLCIEGVVPGEYWDVTDGDRGDPDGVMRARWVRRSELKSEPGRRSISAQHVLMYEHVLTAWLKDELSALTVPQWQEDRYAAYLAELAQTASGAAGEETTEGAKAEEELESAAVKEEDEAPPVRWETTLFDEDELEALRLEEETKYLGVEAGPEEWAKTDSAWCTALARAFTETASFDPSQRRVALTAFVQDTDGVAFEVGEGPDDMAKATDKYLQRGFTREEEEVVVADPLTAAGLAHIG